MKRALTTALILAVCAASTALHAQNVAIGERMPSLRNATRWISGYKPEATDFTYVEFVCSASSPCRESVQYIAEFVRSHPGIRMIVLTKESADHVEPWLAEYAGGRCGVAIECGKVFEIFGVNYAPFGVLLDARRRVRWLGNPKQLSHGDITTLTGKTRREAYGIH